MPAPRYTCEILAAGAKRRNADTRIPRISVDNQRG